MRNQILVLDTSAILADPNILTPGNDHVIIPFEVLEELHHQTKQSDMAGFARTALDTLETLRETQSDDLYFDHNQDEKDQHCGSLQIAASTNQPTKKALLALTRKHDAALITQDPLLRMQAETIGLTARAINREPLKDPQFDGVLELETTGQLDELFSSGKYASPELPENMGLILKDGTQSALARVKNGHTQLVRDANAFGVRGRSAEQKLALAMLLDPSIGIVSLGGKAGTGKSALALAAAMQAVCEEKQHTKIIVFRPLYSVGGQDLGFLPGSEAEKMGPWGQAVFDTLGAITNTAAVEHLHAAEQLEVLPLTHIRGRSLHDAFVIVDEAQQLEHNVLLSVLSRIGQNSKVVLTHDVAQRDNMRVGRHDGIAAVVEKLRGHKLFAHITLKRSERSAIAALVTELLDEGL